MSREEYYKIVSKNKETQEELVNIVRKLHKQLFTIHSQIECVNNCLAKYEEINEEIYKLLGISENE